jgi:RNA-directed DNA polymerase
MLDRNYIREKFSLLSTKYDFLALLNEVKADELGCNDYPFTIEQINYYSNPNRTEDRYVNFDIPKKSGKEPRHISAPVNGLKSILTFLNHIFQALYDENDCAYGFVPGRSVVDNARNHVGQNYVYNIDLKDFFTSIEQYRIWSLMQLPPYNLNKDVASVITGLCCMKIQDGDKTKFVLPQGAPTSPMLTNIVCEQLDHRLEGLAKRFGLHYSRYADDITFSSMHNVYQRESDFIKELHRIIAAQRLTINEDKTRLQKRGSRQEVTGITVCEKTNVARKYYRELRSILHIWEQYGYDEAYKDFLHHYQENLTCSRNCKPILENVINGKLQYLRLVKGTDDELYIKLQKRYEALYNEYKHKHGKAVIYKETFATNEFEEKMCAKIIYKRLNNCDYAYFIKNGKKMPIFMSKSLSQSYNGAKQISLCEDEKGKKFYLMHYPLPEQILMTSTQHIEDSYSVDKKLNELINSGFDLNTLLYGTK